MKIRNETYFVSAGEHSGDLLGADLVLALKERFPRLTPVGIAGDAMIGAGVRPLAHVNELSVMGVTEVARKIPAIRLLESRVLHRVDYYKPRFAVLVDNPTFHLRLAEQLSMRKIPVYQYIAPKIWAHGESRAIPMRKYYKRVLGILPFEEDVYQKNQVAFEYVGSPLKDRTDKVIVRRSDLGIKTDRLMVACLPGSRIPEVTRMLPVMSSIVQRIHAQKPNALFLAPISRNIEFETISEMFAGRATFRPADDELAIDSLEAGGIRFVRGMSLEIMSAADAAMVTSGTATLECALLGTPMLVLYIMNELSFQIAKKTLKVPFASLVNLIAGRKIVSEFIQDFTLDEVTAELNELISDTEKRDVMIDRFQDIRDNLKGTAAANAAAIIADLEPIRSQAPSV